MASPPVTTYRALASPSRVEILHVLQEQGELPLADICRAVQLHHNTTREHLDRLVDAGFVERKPEHRGTRGRPRMLYRAAEAPGHRSLDSHFREHFMRVLVASYGSPIEAPAHEARRAGEEWVAQALGERERAESGADDDGMRQLAALELHLDELGLNPEVEVGLLEVHLRRCPFADLARERTEVVCSVHLGVARGILQHEGGPIEAERLDPMVEPSHCVLYLRRGDASAPSPGTSTE
ncbi:MAG: helix-turn-helix domain-containing protein [Actinomycetota bacterium]|nr:helix-turn-helix domain-containing protein [Actinomycetota bacterium]